MVNRVWILGAGFSVPLGGPLLRDLLSMRTWKRHRASGQLSGHPWGQPWAAVYVLYHYGRDFPEGYCFDQPGDTLGRGEKHFTHAEDFLVRLEEDDWDFFAELWAGAGKAMSVELGDLFPREKLLRAARFLLAIDTQDYLERADVMSSTWGPYQRWARCLNDQDAVVTFNYDTVVERVKGMLNIAGIGSDMTNAVPMLCKLHGSVDWELDEHGVIHRGDYNAIIKTSAAGPLIGIPGKSKDEFGDKPPWHRTRAALTEASEVYIMGYSLPPSDAASRDLILRALTLNTSSKLDITLVLGDDERASHRLESMLGYALRGLVNQPKIHNTKLFVEDFMDAYALRLNRPGQR